MIAAAMTGQHLRLLLHAISAGLFCTARLQMAALASRMLLPIIWLPAYRQSPVSIFHRIAGSITTGYLDYRCTLIMLLHGKISRLESCRLLPCSWERSQPLSLLCIEPLMTAAVVRHLHS